VTRGAQGPEELAANLFAKMKFLYQLINLLMVDVEDQDGQ
jgi:hypothetical protein